MLQCIIKGNLMILSLQILQSISRLTYLYQLLTTLLYALLSTFQQLFHLIKLILCISFRYNKHVFKKLFESQIVKITSTQCRLFLEKRHRYRILYRQVKSTTKLNEITKTHDTLFREKTVHRLQLLFNKVR